jgi:hypothetical protein
MQLVPMTAAYAAEIVTWRYPAPYDIYDMPDEDAAVLTGADGGFFALTGQHELIGFRSFGTDGQVPGHHRHLQRPRPAGSPGARLPPRHQLPGHGRWPELRDTDPARTGGEPVTRPGQR